ncbi:thioredoxin domain-containing protein [Tessaracoccus sp. OH4464_COT-324]|uniref:DsbA family protein n=1 Tax=Tessaracoccus sp. OH4464_COT-324 TaxID=2491059 RepID=UPI000F640F2C|nr:thioredoxin domain-containing protein [Tessaracoccus sp. OH4464_COT-324]RRD46288.1 thioredoxin [Tessaracoccus sp. OH4464_COT-324]
MASNQNLSRRAALQQQLMLEEKRKRTNRIITWVSAILVVAVLAVIVILTVPALLNKGSGAGGNETPPNATAEFGILLDGKKPQDGVPHLVIYEDFRCPACKHREDDYGPIYKKLAAEGKLTVEYRTAYFLDRGRGDNSQRAAIAAATADAVGRYSEYASVLFKNQAPEYTDEQLRTTFAEEAGITGDELKKFQGLYDSRAFAGFARSANDAFNTSGVTATPSYVVNGRLLVFYDEAAKEVLILPDENSFLTAVTKATEGADDRTNKPL